MNYARKVVDDLEEQNMEHINACDRVHEDLKALWKNYKELVKELGEIINHKVQKKIRILWMTQRIIKNWLWIVKQKFQEL